jgi:hypothetical protein
MFFMGVYPRVFLDRSKASVGAVHDRINGKQGGGSYTVSTTGCQPVVDAIKPRQADSLSYEASKQQQVSR